MSAGPAELRAALRDAESAARRGDWRAAVELAQNLVKRFPREPRGWYLFSIAAMNVGRAKIAADAATRAIDLQPAEAELRIQLARCLVADGDQAAGLLALEQAEALAANSASGMDAIGTLYSFCDEQQCALACFESAVAADPKPEHLFNLATAQRMTGDLSGAEATCDRVIEMNPQHCRAHFMRANLRPYQAGDNHIDRMSDLAGKVNDWRGVVLLQFAIAKECEDVGDYVGGFQHLKTGADLQRAHMRYSVDNDIAVIDELIKSHTRDALADRRGSSADAPIFVLGLPRSGTTLVDRIVSSHTEVKSLGEINAFAEEMQEALAGNSGGGRMSREQAVQQALQLDFEALGDAYVAAAQPRFGDTSRFIDKMPLNFLYCGLINAALPNARIVHLTRHPMDVCYAIYKTHFTGVYPFSYDLDELAKYYLAYHRLMDHWRAVLGDAILDVSYEALVEDQKGQTRRLLNFCGLPWQDACLRFHENAAASTSASAAQVRRPIYRSSVELWRSYAEQLRPLKERLIAAGVLEESSSN